MTRYLNTDQNRTSSSVRPQVADPGIFGKPLHGLIERIDDLQHRARIIPFQKLDDLQQVALSSRREDEIAHDAERSFCLS